MNPIRELKDKVDTIDDAINAASTQSHNDLADISQKLEAIATALGTIASKLDPLTTTTAAPAAGSGDPQ